MRRLSVVGIPAYAALLAALSGAPLPGCSWTFDDSAPDVPLLGDPVLPDGFPKLNVEPASDDILLSDSDGNPWVAMPVAAQLTLTLPPPPQTQSVCLLRLDKDAPTDGRQRKELSADHYYITGHAVYLIDPPSGAAQDDPTAPTHVTVVPAGISATAHMFSMPTGPEFFTASSGDQTFVYWVPKGMDPRVFVTRTDGSYQRALAPPKGFDSDATSGSIRIFLNRGGDHIYIQDSDHRIKVYETTSEASLDLGVQPTSYVFDNTQSRLVFCSDKGLMSVAVDGTRQELLDSDACDPNILRVSSGYAYYESAGALRRTPLDASLTPQVVVPAPIEQLLAIGPHAAIVYSLDSPLTYGSGIGDGWLGGWQFMQRGRRPAFSLDGTRLRWFENAARSDGSGDLTSATIADHAVLQEARNVRNFAELSDGRVLAISNAAFKGTQNRLIVIDEKSRTARWVVDSARDFAFIPGSSDLLVKIVVGQLGYDIRRVPIPPPIAP